MQIPILYEPNYLRDSIWCEQIRIGIEQLVSQRRYSLYKIDGNTYQNFDFDSFFRDAPRLLIVVSTYQTWTMNALSFFEKKNICVILVDTCSMETRIIKGQVLFHYEDAVQTLLAHLRACGCFRTALFGHLQNSSADSLKKKYFLQELQTNGIPDAETVCFENTISLFDCYCEFQRRVREFDSVICVNDIAAIVLTKYLIADGIRVPEDIQIVTAGATTKLRQSNSLTITGIDFSNCDLGKNAVLLYCYLRHNSCDCESNPVFGQILVSGKLTVGKSTMVVGDVSASEGQFSRHPTNTIPSLDFYESNTIRAYSRLETLIQSSDEIDIRILKYLLEDNSYEKISKALFLARSSIHYRIRCLEKVIGVTTLEALKDFLRSNQFEDIIRIN